jgi:O-antigen ligase
MMEDSSMLEICSNSEDPVFRKLEARFGVARRIATYPLVGAAFTSSWTAVSVAGFKPVDILLAAAFLLTVLDMISGGRSIHVPVPVAVASLAVLVVVYSHQLLPAGSDYLANRFIVPSPFSAGPPESGLVKGLQWLVALTVVPVLLIDQAVSRGSRALYAVMSAWCAGISLSAFISLTDYLDVTSVSYGLLGYTNISGRQSGLAAHPNDVGVATAMAASFAVLVSIHWRVVGTGLLSLLGVGAILSGSRGGQVGLVFSLVALVAISPRSRSVVRWAFVAMLVPLGILALLGFGTPNFSAGVLRWGGSEADTADSNHGRHELAVQALRDFSERPLDGIGLSDITGAHSIYLQLISAGGIILLGSFGGLLATAVAAAWRRRAAAELLGAAAFVAVATWLLVGIIENQLVDRYLYFAIGSSFAINSMCSTKSSGSPSSRLRLPDVPPLNLKPPLTPKTDLL